MTGTHDKIRSLFLTVLMVVSVFGGTVAFTGGAAANHPVTVDQGPVEYEDADGNNLIEVVFDQGNVTDEGDQYTYTVYDRTGSEVGTFSPTADSAGPKVVLDVGTDLSGEATLNVEGADFDENFTVTTTSSTVEDGAADEVAYDGERVAVLAGSENTRFEVFSTTDDGSPDEFMFGRSTGENSNVSVVDTGARADLEGGESYVFDFDGGASTSLNLRNLGLTAEAQSDTEAFRQGSATVSVDVSANDVGRDIEARLLNEDGDEVDTQTATIDSDGEVTVDLEADAEGNYTVEVEDIDTGITDETDTVTVTQITGDATFSQSVYEEERGDVASLTLEMENVNEATVQIGDDASGYNVTVDVTDDGDGEVTINANTYSPADEGTYSVEGADSSDVTVNTAPSRPLDAASYDVSAEVEGAETDVATLVVSEGQLENISTHVAAPSTHEDIESADDVEAAIDDGLIGERDEIAEEDVVVLQIGGSGFYGALAGQGGDATTQFTSFVNTSAADFEIRETAESRSPNQPRKTINLTASDATVVTDEENDNLYVLLNTNDVNVTDDDGQERELETDDEFETSFTLNADSQIVDEDSSVSDSFSIVERRVEWDTENDQVVVDAAENQQIGGTTTVAPGTQFTVRARATGDSPFLKTNSTTVHDHENETGSFHANFDFTNVSQNQTFTVSIREGDFQTVEGVVGEAPQASVTIEDQSSDGTEVTVASAELSEGGFVTIHDGSLFEGATLESVRGSSDYLEEGSHSDITITLDEPYEESGTAIAMPHLDTNDNQEYDFVDSEGAEDGPYTTDEGDAVVDDAALEIEEETPTPTEETPTPTEETPTPTEGDGEETPTPTEGDGEETPTPEPEQPGFGLVVALVALLGAALLAVRRQA